MDQISDRSDSMRFANDLLNLNGGYIVLGVETDAANEAILPPRGLGSLNPEQLQKEILLENAILSKKAGDFKEAHALLSRLYPSMMDDPKVVHELAQTKLRDCPVAWRAAPRSRGRESQRNREDRALGRRLNEEGVELLHRAIQLASDRCAKPGVTRTWHEHWTHFGNLQMKSRRRTLMRYR